jgi:serine/threonine protein kinase
MTPQEKPQLQRDDETLPPRQDAPTLPPAPAVSSGDRTEVEYRFLAPAAAADEIGRLGSYRVLKVLGSGGMGVVFQGEDPQLKRPVALKAMLPGLAADRDARERFLREARAAAAVNHNHIVTIYQVGEAAGTPFLAMELLEGQSLEQRLESGGPIPVPEALRIARETAEGLAAAHAQGLIHRDIKPANIWLEKKAGVSRVKLLDFGVARVVKSDARLTQEGAIIGTPSYMAPEQALGKAVDGRSDLFSLGCVLYRLCTGSLPFRGLDTISTLMAIATEAPVAPSRLNPDLPKRLEQLILRLLAKTPAERPRSAAAVVAELRSITRDLAQPRTAPPVIAGVEARREQQPKKPPLPRRRRPVVLLVAAATAVTAAAFLLAVAAGLLWHFRPSKSRTPDTVAAEHTAPAQSSQAQPDRTPTLPSSTQHGKPPITSGNPSPNPSDSSFPGPVVHRIVPDPANPILKGHTGKVVAIQFLPNGRQAASLSWDGTVRIWDLATGKAEKVIQREKILSSLAVSRDGKRLAFGGTAYKIYLFDLAADKDGPLIRVKDAATTEALAFSDNSNRLFVANGPGTLQFYRARDGEFLFTQRVLRDALTRIRLAPGGKYAFIAASGQASFVRWDLVGNKQASRFAGEPPFATLDMAPFADGERVASVDAGGAVHIWSIESGVELSHFKAHHGIAIRATSVHVLNDDRWILTTGEDRAIRIWDVKSRKKLFEHQTDTLVTSVADVSPDQRLLLTGAGWRLTSRSEVDNDFALRLWHLPAP